MAQAIRSVGFIGLGSMGGCQARELAKLALPLTVHDKFPAAMEPFRGKEHTGADNRRSWRLRRGRHLRAGRQAGDGMLR